jgi:hypothetical protein
VSTTPALELGIDVGGLDACIIVGYLGTRASFFQQAGRAGRRLQDAVVFLVGLDTSVNQYIMSHPGYLFDRPVETAVIDPGNPFVALGHVWCAVRELALAHPEAAAFGPHAGIVLRVLAENAKVKMIGGSWYPCSADEPHRAVALRSFSDATVVIEDAGSGAVIGEVDRYDAEPLVHPDAIYLHRGDTYRVTSLDLERNRARVVCEETDYYTQPLGGAAACWGEVTVHMRTYAFEKIHFYTLDAVSVHGLDLPAMALETMALWYVPPDDCMRKVAAAGRDPHAGLRGIGYAVRGILPLFVSCDTRDFSHTIGSVNSPWNALFIYERFPLGLGFTRRAYESAERILRSARDAIRGCSCADGCPCCVGKPLRGFSSWNVERGEGSIPCKDASLMILDGIFSGKRVQGASSCGGCGAECDTEICVERMLRRRLERMREPGVSHPVTPERDVSTGYGPIENGADLEKPDMVRRRERRLDFEKELHRRIAKKTAPLPFAAAPRAPAAMRAKRGVRSVVAPADFPGRPVAPPGPRPDRPSASGGGVAAGDATALKAWRAVKRKKGGTGLAGGEGKE